MPERTESEGIRVVAVGVVRRDADDPERGHAESERDEELLVSRHCDPAGEFFYRPVGGGVEFGEHSEESLRREFREELGVTLSKVSALGTYEDVFTAEGETHHELWRLYEVEIAEEWPYQEDEFTATEPETGEEIECVWKPVAALGSEDEDGDTFYPEALLADR